MSTSKDYVLEAMRRQGRETALSLQEQSVSLSGTELNAQAGYIPDFLAAKAVQNMLTRKAGQTDGFICKSSAGRVVRLIQNYDSEIFPGEPEELPAQWRFVWSTDPAKALPFIALSTSPYAAGECCRNAAGEPKRSNIDNNVFDPDDNPQFWDDP